MEKRVVSNSRAPFKDEWSFCDFIDHYRQPEWGKNLYVVSQLEQTHLQGDILVPPVLQCNNFLGTSLSNQMEYPWLWMSSGNTTSSLHFDTSDNLVNQIDGTKTVLLWSPEYSRQMYIDHHDKFGLSPINVENVDLLRFPKFANGKALVAELRPGDTLYIPKNWWHQIKSYGRNIALNMDWYPYGGFEDEVLPRWPEEIEERVYGASWSDAVMLEHFIVRATPAPEISCADHAEANPIGKACLTLPCFLQEKTLADVPLQHANDHEDELPDAYTDPEAGVYHQPRGWD